MSGKLRKPLRHWREIAYDAAQENRPDQLDRLLLELLEALEQQMTFPEEKPRMPDPTHWIN